ncbi:hypothetical protein GGR51DRAFT_500902 [Nemania sp. FL0031]|nr:hypothetical protein GGR51DRAFT_500902 [Nemania sp. FL0031]
MMSVITRDQVKLETVFEALSPYLAPDSTIPATQAAASFAESVKTPNEEFFWDFWRDIFSVAEGLPHASPAQDKLVSFVRDLTLEPTSTFSSLPLLGASIREHLDRIPTASARVSFHAFVARLFHAGVSPGSETTAIWMLRAALEEQPGSEADVDRDLMVAAMYIEYAGATLVQKLALQPEPALDDAQQRSLRGGALWKGKSGLTAARWAFWGRRFRELGVKASSQEARDLALHAARRIEVSDATLNP